MLTDDVILLDESGEPVGTMSKRSVHTADTPLHLAFSVYLFDSDDRVLLTRRALSKITWPGVWSNSCCGHVRPGEGTEDAAVRRLREELGLSVDRLDLIVPDFRYRARSPQGIVENEVCPVFAANLGDASDVALSPDPEEVMAWTWVPWPSFCAVASDAPALISPWAALQAPRVDATRPG